MGMEISMEKLRRASIGVRVLPAGRTRTDWPVTEGDCE